MKELFIVCLLFVSQVSFSQNWSFQGGYDVRDTPWASPRANPVPESIGGNYLSLDSLYKPGVREHCGGGLVNNNEIYIYGGACLGWQESSDLWVYDISQKEWAFIGNKGYFMKKSGFQIEKESNNPGNLNRMASAVDSSGNLWFFGGKYYSQELQAWVNSSHLWSLNTKNHNWTYWGQKDDFSTAPEKRYRTRGWIYDNKFWIYGGAIDYPGISYSYNDLWYFDLSLKDWVFVSGNKNQFFSSTNNGNYPSEAGIKGTQYFPSSRSDYAYWVDENSGKFYLYGGLVTSHGADNHGDLWSFSPATSEWELIQGDNTVNTPLTDSLPGARNAPYCWKQNDGKLYMFGGNSNSSLFYNDLWMYDLATNTWSTSDSQNHLNQRGNYVEKFKENQLNWPGSQVCTLNHITTQNYTYMYNGYGFGVDSTNDAGFTGGIWRLPVREITDTTSFFVDCEVIDNVNDTLFFEIRAEYLSNDSTDAIIDLDLNTELAGFQHSFSSDKGSIEFDNGLIKYIPDSTLFLGSDSLNHLDSIKYVIKTMHGNFSGESTLKIDFSKCGSQTLESILENEITPNSLVSVYSNSTSKFSSSVTSEPSSFIKLKAGSKRSLEFLPGAELVPNSLSSFEFVVEGCPEQ